MSSKIIANRYAKALFNQAGNDFSLAGKYVEELEGVLELFNLKQSADILKSPVMPADLKLNLLNYGLEKASASHTLKGFINSVVEAGRVNLIPEIVETYKTIVNDARGIVDVTITSAIPLPQNEINSIVSELEKISGKKINVNVSTDSAVLGGFVVKMGNTLLDLSLKTKLDAITKSATL